MHRDTEHRDIFGMVFGAISAFGMLFGLLFGYIFSFPTLFGLIFGFGMIWGVISFLSLVERHYRPHYTMPEADLDAIMLFSSLGVGHRA